MINADSKRRHATIENVRSGGEEDRGIISAWVGLKFDVGYQAFGGIVLDEVSVELWRSELATAFTVAKFEHLVGLECYALWSLGEMSESIQGIESMAGKRFTSSSFVRRHYPNNFKKPIYNKIDSLRSDIRWAIGRAQSAQSELDTIKLKFTDWDDEP